MLHALLARIKFNIQTAAALQRQTATTPHVIKYLGPQTFIIFTTERKLCQKGINRQSDTQEAESSETVKLRRNAYTVACTIALC